MRGRGRSALGFVMIGGSGVVQVTRPGLQGSACFTARWTATVSFARSMDQSWITRCSCPQCICERRVRVWLIRQQILTRDPPLDLSAVIDESVLRRLIGGRAGMDAQLPHLNAHAV